MNTKRAKTKPALGVGGREFQVTHFCLDLLSVALAWRATQFIRLLINPYVSTKLSAENLSVLAPPIVHLLLLWVVAAVWLKTYSEREDTSIVGALARILESSAVVSTLAIALTFLTRQFGPDRSRSLVLLFIPTIFVCLVISLYFSLRIASEIRKRWHAPERMAILGGSAKARELVQSLHEVLDPRGCVRGIILMEDDLEENSQRPELEIELPVLGTSRQMAEVINRECIDRIIVADDSLGEQEFEYLGQITKRMGVTLSRPIPAPAAGVQTKYQERYGFHWIEWHPAPFSHREEMVKRLIDFSVSLAIITLLLPLFCVLAALIRFTSDGPVFYRSLRVGRGGRYFTFWKFRSMYVDAARRDDLLHRNENSGHLFKIRHDPRVTPLGRVMRRLSLDELPQLFNVLAGDMSIVGPRPLPVEDLDPDGLSREFTHWAEARAKVRPGITGLWQVKGRSELSFDQMVHMDTEYVRTWSLSLDLRILCETPAAVFSGRGAY